MYNVKFLFFFLFVAIATGVTIPDLWKKPRETCRKRLGLTQDELEKLATTFNNKDKFIPCLGRELGNLSPDGTVNKENFVNSAKTTVPSTILRSLAECCIDQIYKGKKPNRKDVDRLFNDFVICAIDKIPPGILDLIGVFKPAAYPPFDTCPA